MNDATRILMQFRDDLDKHFGLKISDRAMIKPEAQLSDETAERFARMIREDQPDIDAKVKAIELRVAKLEKLLGVSHET